MYIEFNDEWRTTTDRIYRSATRYPTALVCREIRFIVFFIYSFDFSNLLQQHDTQMLQVCLDALHNILKQISTTQLDNVTREIEECGGKTLRLVKQQQSIDSRFG